MEWLLESVGKKLNVSVGAECAVERWQKVAFLFYNKQVQKYLFKAFKVIVNIDRMVYELLP